MNRHEARAAIFRDTMEHCRTDAALSAACAQAREGQCAYAAADGVPAPEPRFDDDARIVVSKKRSFEAAEPYARAGAHVAVLNFANSFHPGGGVVRGSSAQEESLCRASTLYAAISAPEMHRAFYEPHCASGDLLATDDVIFTPGVVVFKTDTALPQPRPADEWFTVDVLTCAAPNLRNGAPPDFAEELHRLHERRIRRILRVAAHHGADTLILGAFGCGAFRNPPEIVADAFKSVLPEFQRVFKMIEFAVYCTDYDAGNYEAFARALAGE